LAMMAVEALGPARRFPQVRFWRLTGILFMLMMGALSAVAPLLLDERWLADHRLMDSTGLGIAGGAAVGFLFLSLVHYALHRARPRVVILWRVVHQLHHSPVRVDMGGAALFHPVEGLLTTLIPVCVSVFVLGLDPRAAAIASFAVVFCGLFQHWNVRTP